MNMDKDKEINWFVNKYINNDKNLDLFLDKLSPFGLSKIFYGMIQRGLAFTWGDEDLPEEFEQQKKCRKKRR